MQILLTLSWKLKELGQHAEKKKLCFICFQIISLDILQKDIKDF